MSEKPVTSSITECIPKVPEGMDSIEAIFREWNEFDKTMALCSLLQQVPPNKAHLIILVLQEQLAKHSDLQRKLLLANDPGYINSLHVDVKEDAIQQLVYYLPLVRTENSQVKECYLRIIPKIAKVALETGFLLEETLQLISYCNIHPAFTIQEREDMSLWKHQVENLLSNSNKCTVCGHSDPEFKKEKSNCDHCYSIPHNGKISTQTCMEIHAKYNLNTDMKLVQDLKNTNWTHFKRLVKMHLNNVLDLNIQEWSSPQLMLDVLLCNFSNFKSNSKDQNKGDPVNVSLLDTVVSQVYQLIKYLDQEKNLTVEGIFRRSGKVSRQAELLHQIRSGKTINFDDCTASVHEVACVLKTFLVELAEPLLTEAHFPIILKIADLEIPNTSLTIQSDIKGRQLRALQLLFLLIPPQNQKLLEELLHLLNNVALHSDQNRMSAANLAIVFTPALLCPRKMPPEDLQQKSGLLTKAVTFMVQSSSKLFSIPDELLLDIRALCIFQKENAGTHQKCHHRNRSKHRRIVIVAETSRNEDLSDSSLPYTIQRSTSAESVMKKFHPMKISSPAVTVLTEKPVSAAVKWKPSQIDDVAVNETFDSTEEDCTKESSGVEEKSNVSSFRDMLDTQILTLNSLTSEWQEVLEYENPPEGVSTQITIAIDLSNQLVENKLKQFEGLVNDCEMGEDKELHSDLFVYWDILSLFLRDVKSKFFHLEMLRCNNWLDVREEEKTHHSKHKGGRVTAKEVEDM